MQFPVAIHKEPGSSYGVSMPDFPGCTSAGETVAVALTNAVEAIEGWVEMSIESGDTVKFEPSDIDSLRDNPDWEGAMWAFVDIDPARFDVTQQRVNISLPRFVLAQIDAYAEKHRKTRSGFMVDAALEAIRRNEQAAA